MVGHIPLEDGIGVRVPDPQPMDSKKKYVNLRPHIPAALQREIKIEAHHSCLVCEERVSLVIHHIDGHRENNVPENLAYICSNCHGMVHEGKIDAMELREYKKKARARMSSEERLLSGTELLETELKNLGYLEFEAFWDETFPIDIFSLSIGTTLIVSIDDVADRTAALMAHTEEGVPVGVVLNKVPDSETYHEFTQMVIEALRKSKFKVIFSEKGEVFKIKKLKGERHYFKVKTIS